MEIVEATGHVLEAGKSSELTALLATVADATTMDGDPRYAPKICRDLARAVVCRKYSRAVLQLCHLINAVDACGSGKGRWEQFFFGLDKVRGSAIRAWLTEAVQENGWRRPGFDLDGTGLHMKFPDGEFELGYGRMPLLTALLEIVVTIVGYEAIDQILSDMTTGAADEAAISDAANAVNRLVYNWLKDHLPGTQAGEKFETIVRFLSSTGKDGSVEISDDTILAFWQRQNDGQGGASDFRTFRSALGGFVDFLRAVETGSTRSMVSFARPLGTDHDAGEVDPMFDDDDAPAGAWQTPLALLDMPPADAIKFLNKRERDDLDLLMDCGPLAIDLPLSVLRCEVFGTVQGRITQALRRKVAKKEIHQLAACGEAEPYGERTGRYHDHEQHLLRVQKAVLHALTSDDVDDEDTEARQPETSDTSNVIPLFGRNTLTDTAREQSQDAFKTLNRKGFSQNDLDNPDIREGFSIGAGALVQARDHLADFLVVLARLQTGDEDLAQVFAHDRTTFSDLFAAMYGAKK